jgi:NLR family CARD domain-containing protein 3
MDTIQLVPDAEDGSPQSRPPSADTERKQAWARAVPVVAPFPNIFEFIPIPEIPVLTVDATPTGSPRPGTTALQISGPREGIKDEPPQLSADKREDRLKLSIVQALEAEKTYPVPTDYTEFGWLQVYQLGICLSYKTMLLRRDVSPRCLVLDEDTSVDARAFRPLLTTACVVLASAGLPWNESTEELVIRQRLPPTPQPMKEKKKKNRNRRPRSPARKYVVLPALRSRGKAKPTPTPSVNASSQSSRVSRRRPIESNKIGSDGAIAIFRALRVNTHLRSLTLENAGITDLAMGALGAMLRVNCTLVDLSLRRNRLTHLGIHVLCQAVEESPDSSLLRLDLSRNTIADAGVPALCQMLVENETLVWLDLSWNQLSSTALLSLLRSLKENFVLRELSVFGKDIDEDQYCLNLESRFAREIASALRQVNPSFANIRLSSDQALLPVDKMKSSRWITLPSRELVELDALVIAGLIPLNKRLLTLDLSNNRGIERWAILELLKSIRYCKTLKHVQLANTGLYVEVGEQVGDLVASNATLETITMHDEPLQVQQWRGKDQVDTLQIQVPPTHHFDRWILAKCLLLNRATQELNRLRLPVASVPLLTGAAPTKVSINYSLRKLEPYEVVFLARKVFYHLHIGRVALNGCGIDSFGGVALADGVRNHASLETLEIENNAIGTRGGCAMAECITFNTSLSFLNLSWNSIGNDGVRGFEAGLQVNKALRRLDLRGNALTAAGIVAVANGLHGNACLQELYLRWNTICASGAEALARALTQNKSLRLLDIEHHTMGPRGALAFAAMLRANNRLQELNMKGDDSISDGDATGIGSDAARALALALMEKNRTLTHWCVAQNQIGRDGVAAFSDLVKFGTTLQVLDLSIGEMDGKIAERFFECLSMNKTIVKLNLAHNRVSNEGMLACIRMLDANRVLQELNVAYNAITEEPLALLAAKWQRKKQQSVTKHPAGAGGATAGPLSLKWLCLIGNTMTEKTRRALLTLAPMVTIELDEEGAPVRR